MAEQRLAVSEGLVNWLATRDEPWVTLNARLDLLGQPPDAPEVRSAYRALTEHPRVAELLDGLQVWPQARPLSRAYDAKDALWKLAILADFGLKRDVVPVATVAETILTAQAPDGEPPGFLHGGFDHTKSWDKRPYICISHVMTYALAKFGYLEDPRLQRAYDYLTDWQRLDGDWQPTEACLPGREREREPSCPFGTVNVPRAVAAHPELRTGR